MTDRIALDTAQQAILVALALAGPPLIAALVVGVIVSLFQAMTQINEMALSFIPKLLAVIGVFAVLGSWMLQTVVTYTAGVIAGLPHMVR